MNLVEYDCDLDPTAGGLDICDSINGYPTFCCPGDADCSFRPSSNIQVGYADGTMDQLIAAAQAKCEEFASLQKPPPFCPKNSTN